MPVTISRELLLQISGPGVDVDVMFLRCTSNGDGETLRAIVIALDSYRPVHVTRPLVCMRGQAGDDKGKG